MNNKTLEMIQEQIGYRFQNLELLRQAFTQRSFTEGTFGITHNKEMRMLGAPMLDAIVTKKLVECLGTVKPGNNFNLSVPTTRFTELKEFFVSEHFLAGLIDALGFAAYLLLGKGAVNTKTHEQSSVKAGLFKSIICAVMIDSDSDFEILEAVADKMGLSTQLENKNLKKKEERGLKTMNSNMTRNEQNNNLEINRNPMDKIQEELNYQFHNVELLKQAFTRRSYSEEHNGAHHNEVLEFYGDKALEFIVMKKLSEHFGEITQNGKYASQKTEGQLTEFKKKLVCKKMLAHRIDVLDFADCLLMGKGDEAQNAQDQESVKEDLFEAIVGAVALDSGWKIEALTTVIDKMLTPAFYFENGFDDEPDYVQLVQQWCQKKYRILPSYSLSFGIGSPDLFKETPENAMFTCNLNIPNIGFFSGVGVSKADARRMAAKKAYLQLENNNCLITIRDEMGVVSPERAINQLQELYQKGHISEPQYTFSEKHDLEGNLIWECGCFVQSLDMGFSAEHSSKKAAKKAAACYMLTLGLGEIDNHEA